MKYFLFALVLIFFFAACTTSPTPQQEKVKETKAFHAVVLDSTMTLGEFAKANQVLESYLRQQLGMPTRAGSTMPLYKLKRNFKFTYDQLTDFVEQAKDH
ncbi:MAG: hypothetical protein Q8O72_05335 [Bacteroidales bacterium]|nr:hypothetical protein [Bacteroidales bacterium]